jgi:hypothetical protein
MFQNIRTTVKNILPNQHSGLHQLKVPCNPTASIEGINPNGFHEYIATTPNNDIIWDTIFGPSQK